MDDEPHPRGVKGAVHHIGEAADALGGPTPDGHLEDLFPQLRDALEDGRSPGENDARAEKVFIPRLDDLPVGETENLLHPGLDDLPEDLAGNPPGRTPPDAHRNIARRKE